VASNIRPSYIVNVISFQLYLKTGSSNNNTIIFTPSVLFISFPFKKLNNIVEG
jgi:hypothetical protein